MEGKRVDSLYACYTLLNEVFRGGKYSTLTFKDALNTFPEKSRSEIARWFYGVLRQNEQLEQIVAAVAAKPPKPAVKIVLKLGIYLVKSGGMPEYAARAEILKLLDRIGKGGVKGFVGAALSAALNFSPPDKNLDPARYYAYTYSLPLWLSRMLLSDYDAAFLDAYFSAKLDARPHVRPNGLDKSAAEAVAALPGFAATEGGGYVSGAALKPLSARLFTVQSLASVLVTRFYADGLARGAKVLDLCAAPGGKAVYLCELIGADMTACDIHPHRVELIASYARRLGAELKTLVNDAAVFRPEFENAFDSVLCDVPCSGIGVLNTKPDILLNRKAEDIAALSELQLSILKNAARYVREGGTVNYSTCTVLRAENEAVIERFLNENPDFVLIKTNETDDQGYLRLYPHTRACDGFFAAKLIKKDRE